MKTIFKSSWLEAISCCGKDLQLKIIRAAIFYQENGILPQDMTPSVRLALRLILALTDTGADIARPVDSAESQDTEEQSVDKETVDEADNDEPEETAADRAAMARALNMLRYPHAGKARKGGKKSSPSRKPHR